MSGIGPKQVRKLLPLFLMPLLFGCGARKKSQPVVHEVRNIEVNLPEEERQVFIHSTDSMPLLEFSELSTDKYLLLTNVAREGEQKIAYVFPKKLKTRIEVYNSFAQPEQEQKGSLHFFMGADFDADEYPHLDELQHQTGHRVLPAGYAKIHDILAKVRMPVVDVVGKANVETNFDTADQIDMRFYRARYRLNQTGLDKYLPFDRNTAPAEIEASVCFKIDGKVPRSEEEIAADRSMFVFVFKDKTRTLCDDGTGLRFVD